MSHLDVKLSFVMSQFYEATNRNAQSCSFGGNATVNSKAASSASASSVASYFDMMSIGGSSFGTSGASSAEGSVFECDSSRSSSPMHSSMEEGSFPRDGELPCPPDSARTTAW